MIMQLSTVTHPKHGAEVRSQLSSSITLAESAGKRIGKLIPEGVKLKQADILKTVKSLKDTVSDGEQTDIMKLGAKRAPL